MHNAVRFRFAPDWTPKGFVVVVPKSVSSRDGLFEFLAGALGFPDYFGENWDALIDCLSDLSWMDSEEVTIAHECLPGLPGQELRTYLECLQDVIERKDRGDTPRINVVFPGEDAAKIETLLGNP
jgi:RNAse (barnase) inhibitor barstar